MVGLAALWLPIVLSAVAVFVASSITHMVLRYHWSDFQGMPGEDGVLEAMRKAGVQPGNYNFPHAKSMAELKEPEVCKKWEQGPVGMLYVMPSGAPAMGKSLAQWFLYSLVVGFLVAYVAGRTLGPGTEYLQVFRVAGTVAFLAYAGSEPVMSIWKGQKWSTTAKNVLDDLIYALLTGGMFGWLWPGA
jgi:hypothetical protein